MNIIPYFFIWLFTKGDFAHAAKHSRTVVVTVLSTDMSLDSTCTYNSKC